MFINCALYRNKHILNEDVPIILIYINLFRLFSIHLRPRSLVMIHSDTDKLKVKSRNNRLMSSSRVPS